MPTIEERVERLERLDTQFLAVATAIQGVRDDLLLVRDAHGQRFADVEAKLGHIEHEMSETEGWMGRRFNDIDSQLATMLTAINRPRRTGPPIFPTREGS